MEKLLGGNIEKPTKIDKLYLRLHEMGSDPLPYGIQPNNDMLEYLFGTASAQHILKKPVELDMVFVPSTLEMTA